MIKSKELTDPNSCMSKARDDEMTFVLLGRDAAAPAVIRAWVRERIRLGKNTAGDPQILEALACANAMDVAAGRAPEGAPKPGPGRECADRKICLRCGDLDAKLSSIPTGQGDYDEGCAKCGSDEFAATMEGAIAILVKSHNRIEDMYFDAAGKLLEKEIKPASLVESPSSPPAPAMVLTLEVPQDRRRNPYISIDDDPKALRNLPPGEYRFTLAPAPAGDQRKGPAAAPGAGLTLIRALNAVDAEPEFPGEPPPEMVEALRGCDQDTAVYALRLAVRMTKDGIKERLRAAVAPTPPDEAPAPASPGSVQAPLGGPSEYWWWCASCRGCRPAMVVHNDLVCACGHVIASLKPAGPSAPLVQAPAAGPLVEAALRVWEAFEQWNNPMMQIPSKDLQWDQLYRALQAMRDLALAGAPSAGREETAAPTPKGEGAMQPIPVAAAERIAKSYGYDQVIVVARRTGDNGGEHVTTYGRTKEHCDVAARAGDYLKYEVMKWAKATPEGGDLGAIAEEEAKNGCDCSSCPHHHIPGLIARLRSVGKGGADGA